MPASLSDYEVLGSIGSGTFGTCKKVRRKRDGKILVWKEVSYRHMSEQQKQMMVSEVNVLRELRHKNIVRYYERVIDKSNATLYIIMELCDGGDLASLIKQFKKEERYIEESFIWKVVHQVTLALHECHGRSRKEKSILHRDLKPANIFLDGDYNCKLGDFGLARILSNDTSFASTFVGTPYYMSPEQMTHEQYNEGCDIWSLGCVLFELAALRPPFMAYSHHDLAKAICSRQLGKLPKYYSDDLKDLINSMLAVNCVERPSTTDILSNPHIQKLVSEMEKRSKLNEDDSDLLAENLKKEQQKLVEREEALYAREIALEKREKEIQAKERELLLKEKMMAAQKSSSKNRHEKENRTPTAKTSGLNKEANDMNNQLIAALRRAAKTAVAKTKREAFLERTQHLVGEEQHWTKLDLIKELCHSMEQLSKKSNDRALLARLSKIQSRSTELQRESLVIGTHNKRLCSM